MQHVIFEEKPYMIMFDNLNNILNIKNLLMAHWTRIFSTKDENDNFIPDAI